MKKTMLHTDQKSTAHELGWVQSIPVAVQFTAQMIGLFGGGHSGKERRSQKRQALQQAGFTWVTSSESNDRDWNIGAWDDAALDNTFAATQKYGSIVIELHNARKLNKSLAQNQQQLFQFIEKNMPATTMAGFGAMLQNPVVLGAGGLALAGGVYATVKSMKE